MLIELAKKVASVFVDRLLPWFASILEPAAVVDAWSCRYRDDHLLHAIPGDGRPPHEFTDGLRIAVERFATDDPSAFLAALARWSSSELLSIHRLMSYGLEKLAVTHAPRIVEYLVADPRRLLLGNWSDVSVRTLALISAVAPHLDVAGTRKLEDAIKSSSPYSESTDRDVRSRRYAREENRSHRFRLLKPLPAHLLSASTMSLLYAESQVFGQVTPTAYDHRLRRIGSPMSTSQMERASDDDIVGLFDELVDATGFTHPTRMLEGGVVQASREFGAFAKAHPDRAIAIVGRLAPAKHEHPVAEAITALADTSMTTPDLVNLIVACDGRCFCSETFRTDAARALEKRAKLDTGLPVNSIDLLKRWLPESVSSLDRSTQQERPDNHPPFLWGWGHSEMLPGGSYPILEALTVALLSCRPHRANDWLDILVEHLPRNETARVWTVFAHYLEWLSMCDPEPARVFLNDLFARYPTLLDGRQGVILLAHASWWMKEADVLRWTRSLRSSTWNQASFAYGELLGVYSVRIPTVRWADEELSRLVRSNEEALQSSDSLALQGAATSIVNLWSDPGPRQRCTDYLIALLERNDSSIDEIVMPVLGRKQPLIDDQGEKILARIATRPERLLVKSGEHAVTWIAAFVFARADLVAEAMEGIASLLVAGKGVGPGAFTSTADELINLSLTLQRMPLYRERGLTVFEHLLEAGLYGVRQALDQVDDLTAWRRPLQK
jgi:hypothetical protein